MVSKIKVVSIVLGLGLVGLFSWRVYYFFFDTQIPQLMITGLEYEGSYAGDMQCIVTSTKSGEISIMLDGKPLINQFRLGSAGRGHMFTIPTKTLANGKHIITYLFTDSTYHKNGCAQERIFYVDNLPLQAALVQIDNDYKVFQGRTLHIQFQANKPIKEARVHALSHEYECFPESKNSLVHETFIPIPCEENPNEYPFFVDIVDRVGNTLRLDNKFQVVVYPFKKHELVVSAETIKQEEQLGIETKKLAELVDELTKKSPHEKLWHGAFCTPIDIVRTSCDFGTIRTTHYKGRYAHKALDITNQPRSIVWAPQDGIVVLKDRFAMSGNTVIIDHGWGILSMFFHLDNFATILVGDKIAKGNPIGTIGKTGYATGYHLHWEMRINNIPVDPMQWTKSTF